MFHLLLRRSQTLGYAELKPVSAGLMTEAFFSSPTTLMSASEGHSSAHTSMWSITPRRGARYSLCMPLSNPPFAKYAKDGHPQLWSLLQFEGRAPAREIYYNHSRK